MNVFRSLLEWTCENRDCTKPKLCRRVTCEVRWSQPNTYHPYTGSSTPPQLHLHSHLNPTTTGRLGQLPWLPIHHCINFKLATLTFKALSSQQPLPLSSLQHPYLPGSAHTLRCFIHHLPAIPRCRTEFDKRAFSFSAPSVWTVLFEIRSSPFLPAFKRLFIYPSSVV